MTYPFTFVPILTVIIKWAFSSLEVQGGNKKLDILNLFCFSQLSICLGISNRMRKVDHINSSPTLATVWKVRKFPLDARVVITLQVPS